MFLREMKWKIIDCFGINFDWLNKDLNDNYVNFETFSFL